MSMSQQSLESSKVQEWLDSLKNSEQVSFFLSDLRVRDMEDLSLCMYINEVYVSLLFMIGVVSLVSVVY
jgi:hypothetical protein